MPRYMVERTFPNKLIIPTNAQGAQSCLTVVGNNAEDGVTWLHSYVSQDKTKTFCIYADHLRMQSGVLRKQTICLLTG